MLYEVITDVHSVARDMKAELGINIFGFSCEGYRGVSQSAGHHIANNGVFKHVVGVITSYSIHYTKLYEKPNILIPNSAFISRATE